MSYTRGSPADGRSAGTAVPAVTFRQVPPGRANLFLDKVKVVQQPFTGWRNPALCLSASSSKLRTSMRTPSFSASGQEARPQRVACSTDASPPESCHGLHLARLKSSDRSSGSWSPRFFPGRYTKAGSEIPQVRQKLFCLPSSDLSIFGNKLQ